MSLVATKNVLSEELLKRLQDYSREGRQPNRGNFFGWNPATVGTSNAIFIFDLEGELKQLISAELVSKGVFKNPPKRWGASIYLMSRGAFIPWHDDGNHKSTCTIYLNKQWDLNWGGYFMYQDSEDIKAYKPEYNMAVSFQSPKMHCTTLTSIDAPLRETLQIFVDEE